MIINCHCHIFSIEDVPADFRERFFLDRKSREHRFINRYVRSALPGNSKLKGWWELSELPTGEIARRLVAEMDEAGVDLCTPLMMDMAFCSGYGGEVRPFEEQIAATREAVMSINAEHSNPRMLAFVAADPRRENVVEITTGALSGPAFGGVKLYPVMGFTPDDRRLFPLYEFCQDKGLPITTHAQWGGIPGLQDYYHLADPDHWNGVLEEFPDLKVNLAHNGRPGSPWQRRIRRLILDHPNVYTDLSYALAMWIMPWLYFRHVRKMLQTPHLQDRVLYGTDWYMGRCFWTETSYLEWFTRHAAEIPGCRVEFSEDDMARLTDRNPRRFLDL